MRKLHTFFMTLLLVLPLFPLAQNPSKDALRDQYRQSFESLLSTKYRTLRGEIKLSPHLQKELQALKSTYLKQINEKIETPSNSAKSASLERSLLLIYPNISKVLLNKSNLEPQEIQQNSALLVALWKQIPNAVFSKVALSTEQLKNDQFSLTFPYHYSLYDDLIDASPRQRDQVLNFLLWTL